MKTVAVTLRDKNFAGEVSDMDALFFAGLLMPNYASVIQQERGLSEAFQQFSAEHAATLAVTSEEEQGRAIEKLSESWSERVLIRLTTNLEIRAAFAQRVKEIFSDIPKTWVRYDSWRDNDGRIHVDSSVRLDVAEIMAIITPITNTLNEEQEVQSKSTAVTLIPPMNNSETGSETENRKKIEELSRQLAIAQSQLDRTAPEGFGKPVS